MQKQQRKYVIWQVIIKVIEVANISQAKLEASFSR